MDRKAVGSSTKLAAHHTKHGAIKQRNNNNDAGHINVYVQMVQCRQMQVHLNDKNVILRGKVKIASRGEKCKIPLNLKLECRQRWVVSFTTLKLYLFPNPHTPPPQKNCTHKIGNWVGSSESQECWIRWKFFLPAENRIPYCPTSSLVTILRYC